MLYKIAHILRDKLPWIWDIIGIINSFLFGLRYGSKMKNVQNILSHFTKTTDEAGNALSYRIESLGKDNLPMLAKMFAEQPASAFDFFKPHGFDELSLNKLAKDKSFLAYIVVVEGTVQQKVCVGYFFQRSFFWGKSFRGYMTDFRWRRKGINKLMNQCATGISSFLGLHVYGTIAPENIASMKSAQAANDVKIIETLRNGDYLVEYLPKS
ncbi:MAG: transcriptional regulator [Prevotella salivae]|nr:transcriptional regulator [Segatella salivae]